MPQSIILTKGTKEIVPFDVYDQTGNVTDLSAKLPKYYFTDSAGANIYNAAATTAVLMRVSCLLDCTAAGPSGLLPIGRYYLYVSFTNGTETPKLGPIYVDIIET